LLLVVEDDEDSRQLCQEYLELRGLTVSSAATGAEALLRVKDGAVRAVLLDLTLPDADGRDLCESLREAVAPREISVIALTGHCLESVDRARFTRVFQKPVNLDELADFLGSLLSPRSD
jgi:CheY-like chemotaxis protein